MKSYKYTLEKSIKKHTRPECSKKTFVLYVDTKTGDHLPEQYGRCDREANCAYYLNPYKDGYAKMFAEKENGNKTVIWQPARPVSSVKLGPKMFSSIKVEIFEKSRKAYHQNNFIQWINKLFDKETVTELIRSYPIGTSKHWPGATIFWQIDIQGKIRSGKIMLFNPETGRRVKSKDWNYINWVHKVLKLQDFNLKQCYFGEHLLIANLNKPVGLVESEQTAIIASVYLPQLVWLAVGNLTNLNAEKCKSLVKRKIILFPDLNSYDNWKIKATELSKLMPGTKFRVSNLLQLKASEDDKTKGFDLADYLIKFDNKEFLKSNGEKSENSEPDKTTFNNKQANVSDPKNDRKTIIIEKNDINTACYNPAMTGTEYSKKRIFTPLWDIAELENSFTGLQVPSEPLKLNRYTTITDIRKNIDSHIETLKNNNGNLIYTPFYDRLMELKRVLKAVKNGN